jgi:hypothetical protein
MNGSSAGSIRPRFAVWRRPVNSRSGSGPLRLKAAPSATNPTLLGRCGLLYNAPFDVGPGEVAAFRDGNLTVEVLFTSGEEYRIRVTRA